ncbi:MAG: hypothetical protein ACXVFL_07735 [Solirubrobacteraceae bacterium]
MTLHALQILAAAKPAGGAALNEIIGATAGAMVVTALLLWLGFGHRSGRVPYLGRAAALGERVSGLPGWAALPSGVATVSLITAVFGMYWDISLHIDVGRDPGPLANPAHYFILVGLFGIFAAGFIAMVLPAERTGPSAIRITEDWYAPLGGVLVCACGAFSLIGFPLDDVWHRLFGQDVTLWGPTHLMLIGGAAMTLVGLAALLVEGIRFNGRHGTRDKEQTWAVATRRVALTGGLMLGLSTFQAEFDFGVPQFRMIFQPMLIMLAAGVGLVLARVWAGRGAALGAVGFFLLIRGGLALLIGPILGEATPHFPLYVAEALVVEAVGFVVGRERPLALGAWSGLGIGTIGLAAEWGWSHVFMPLPWPSALFPEGAICGLAMVLAGGILGAWAGSRLASDDVARVPALRPAAVLAAVVVAALTVFALHKPALPGTSATVALTNATGGPNRTVNADVRLKPASAGEGTEWLTATAWQGGGLVVDRLKKVGPGHFRTTQPIPVHGDWKALIRLHKGNTLNGLPIYLPDDPAIPAKGVPAAAHFTRPFTADHKILQREQKGASAGLWGIAYAIVAAIALALLVLLAWGLHRVAASSRLGGGEPPAARSSARRPTATPAAS